RGDGQEQGGEAEQAAEAAQQLLVPVQRAVPDGPDVAPRSPGSPPADEHGLLGFVVSVRMAVVFDVALLSCFM
uniref:Uncharacterized protein n=1 Tax=Aegilops tauschii subsp. strangulata TaxID=200361 RepID=A0A453C0H7_AEGTS